MAKYGTLAAMEDAERIDKLKPIILEASRLTGMRPAVIAGIISRETRGNPKFFIGDHGHGFGPMQIDIGTRPDLCMAYQNHDISDDDMIVEGAKILLQKWKLFMNERAAVAAYNCGEGNVRKAIKRRLPVDFYTWPSSGIPPDGPRPPGDYSQDVFERAAYFEAIGFAS